MGIKAIIKDYIKKEEDGSKEYLDRKLKYYRQMFDSVVINPWELLDFLGIELYRGDLKEYGVRGFFKINENRIPQICYDQNLSNPKLRYTIMHEVAHKLLLDYVSEYYLSEIERNEIVNIVYDQVCDDNIQLDSIDPIEQLCDNFAIDALMPREILSQFREKQGGSANERRIAQYFGIEEELVKNYLQKRGA